MKVSELSNKAGLLAINPIYDQEVNGVFIQMEDELGGLAAVIGASPSGTRATIRFPNLATSGAKL